MEKIPVENLGYKPYLHNFMADNGEWISSRLDCGIDQITVIRLQHRPHYIVDSTDEDRAASADLFPFNQYRIQRVEFRRIFDRTEMRSRINPVTRWNTPAVCTLSGTDIRVVYYDLHHLTSEYSVVTDDTAQHLIMVRNTDLQNVHDWLFKAETSRYDGKQEYQPWLTVFNSSDSSRRSRVRTSKWASLTSSASANDLRNDVQAFHGSYKWYTDNGIAYRRGYLLYGPPGNGKTTCARVIATQCEMDIYTLNFGAEKAEDATLSTVFDTAGTQVPSIVLLEDIDRIFGRSPAFKTNVTFQHLLNCLDGVGTPEGIIVIATANHPDELDAAILKRPGRFHRIIGFQNPTASERTAYFRNIGNLSETDSASLADMTDRFSYAQIGEAWTHTALECYNSDGPDKPISYMDIRKSISLIRESYLDLKDNRVDKAGFAAATGK